MANSDKLWEKPWTMEQIIEQSGNWNLAGDAALLNSIKSFADNLLANTSSLSDKLDNLLNDLDTVSLRVDICKNEFQSLRNTQFIESRVYEEDETISQEVVEDVVEKTLTEQDKIGIIKESVIRGMNILKNTGKDKYSERPLPFIIGTEEWDKSLVNLEDDDCKDDKSDRISASLHSDDTESETTGVDNKIQSQIKTSDSCTTLPDESFGGNEEIATNPLGHSTFNDEPPTAPQFIEPEQVPQAVLTTRHLADQLAAKLDEVLGARKPQEEPPEINTKPIQKPSKNVLFDDEPPPLDNDNTQPTQTGLFSGGQGLFDDDNEEELFWSNKEVPPVDIEVKARKSSQVTKGLFDSDEGSSSDDGDIFAKKPEPLPRYLQQPKNVPPLFDEEPPALDKSQGAVKKSLSENQSSSTKISLFDDDPQNSGEELFKNDLFASVPEKTKQLFDDIERKIDLFGTPKKFESLFDDDDEEDDLDAKLSINVDVSKENLAVDKNLYESTKSSVGFIDNLLNEDFMSPKRKEQTPRSFGLFDESPPEDKDDDLFEDEPPVESVAKKPVDLFDSTSDDDFDTSKISAIKPARNSTSQDDLCESFPQGQLINKEEPPKDFVAKKPVDLFESTSDDDFETSKVSAIKPTKKSSSQDDLFGSLPQSQSHNKEDFVAKKPVDLFDSTSDDDFEASKVDFSIKTDNSLPTKDDLFGSHSKVTLPKKSFGLFDDSPPEDDFFKNSDTKDIFPKKSSHDLFDDSPPEDDFSPTIDMEQDNLINDNQTSNVLDSHEVPEKNPSETFVEPPGVPEDKMDGVVNSTKPKPGRVKHNLQINVNALVPGYVPKRDLQKSHSLDEEKPVEQPRRPTSIHTTEGHEILQSITKDRPKIQVKRRPSTRKARQEAYRNSGVDFRLPESDVLEEPAEELPKEISRDVKEDIPVIKETPPLIVPDIKETISDPPKTCVLETPPASKAVFADDDDLFATKVLPKTKALFEDALFNSRTFDEDSDEDLFVGKKAPTIQVKKPDGNDNNKPTPVKKSIFDDDDSDEDDSLFSSKTKKKVDVKASGKLFEDDDDGDDDGIFSSKNRQDSGAVSGRLQKPKAVVRTAVVRKLENTEIVEDPLTSLLE